MAKCPYYLSNATGEKPHPWLGGCSQQSEGPCDETPGAPEECIIHRLGHRADAAEADADRLAGRLGIHIHCPPCESMCDSCKYGQDHEGEASCATAAALAEHDKAVKQRGVRGD